MRRGDDGSKLVWWFFDREVADERSALGEVKQDMRSVRSNPRYWEHEIGCSINTVTLKERPPNTAGSGGRDEEEKEEERRRLDVSEVDRGDE